MANNETPELLTKPPRSSRASGRRAATAHDADGKSVGEDGGESIRTCVLTRAHGTRDSLIRLALGPDGAVAPDIRARAPGRGAWIGVTKPELETALAKGKLKGALSRAFKTQAVAVPDELASQIEAQLERAFLDRLGLEARAGTLLTGSDRIEQAARAGQIHMLLHAGDAAEDGNRRLDQAWRMGDGPARGLVLAVPRAILSVALGRENVVHVALTDRSAAARISHALTRWRGFIGTNGEGLPGETIAARPDHVLARRWARAGGEVWAYVEARAGPVRDFAYGVPFARYLDARRRTAPLPASG